MAKKLELLCVILLVSRFIKYMSSFDDVRLNTSNSIDNAQLTETIYRQRKTLETIFRILDTDNSGIYYCLTPQYRSGLAGTPVFRKWRYWESHNIMS